MLRLRAQRLSFRTNSGVFMKSSFSPDCTHLVVLLWLSHDHSTIGDRILSVEESYRTYLYHCQEVFIARRPGRAPTTDPT